MGQGVIVAGEDPPRANVIKLAGNFLLAAAIEAMGEAFALARKYDVAPAELLDVVNGRLFRSPIYENYGKLIAEERYEPAGFKLKYGLKDIRLAHAAGEPDPGPLSVGRRSRLERDRLGRAGPHRRGGRWAQPPAIAGMTVTSSPSWTGAAKPPRKRTSSSFR